MFETVYSMDMVICRKFWYWRSGNYWGMRSACNLLIYAVTVSAKFSLKCVQ